MRTQFAPISPSLKLPAVLAVVEVRDGGPCDGGFGSATCPHCGAEGRYINVFICEDGSRRGAMSGCFKLFPGSNSPIAKLTQEAYKRQRQAKETGKRLASWWADIVAAAEELQPGNVNVAAFMSKVQNAESRRQGWLRQNGYGRRR